MIDTTFKLRNLTFGEMIEAQNKLNQSYRKHYLNDGHKDALQTHDFLTQLIVEFVELISTSNLNFTWWKKDETDPDYWNVKIEAIDMLHFFLGIVAKAGHKLYGNQFEPTQMDFYLGTSDSRIIDKDGVETLPALIKGGTVDRKMFITILEFIFGFNNLCDNSESFSSQEEFLTQAFSIINVLFMSLRLPSDEISAVYKAKMTLNFIRVSEGYKAGTYVKIHNGMEDNERLKPLVEDFRRDETQTLNGLERRIREEFFKNIDRG